MILGKSQDLYGGLYVHHRKTISMVRSQRATCFLVLYSVIAFLFWDDNVASITLTRCSLLYTADSHVRGCGLYTSCDCGGDWPITSLELVCAQDGQYQAHVGKHYRNSDGSSCSFALLCRDRGEFYFYWLWSWNVCTFRCRASLLSQ